MRALQVSQLNQLVTDESGVAIGNRQMALSFLDAQARSKRGCPGAGRVDDRGRGKLSSVGEANQPFSDL